MNDVDKYIANIPEQARSNFDVLRKLVVEQLPDVHEVLSYGVIGYKPDPKKRAVVFISGWRDHVAIYPAPGNPELVAELQPYIKGKGHAMVQIRRTATTRANQQSGCRPVIVRYD